MSPRVPHLPKLASVVATMALLLGACQPDSGMVTRTPGANSPTTPAVPGRSAAAPDPVSGEANVIAGTVMTETGAPVEGARLRVVGYTGGSSLGREIETVTSGPDGTYRYEVPRGLYEVLGEGPLEFEGQTYLFHLDPSDGSCDQEMSDSGIVKDFVLRLEGLMQCLDGVNPDNYEYYHGAAIQTFSQLGSAAPEDIVEYVLEPVRPLADGSAGSAVTIQRTVAAHSSFFGPIDDTSYLYDIPLGRYEVSASLIRSDGSRTALLVSGAESASPGPSVELSFEPRLVVGTLSVGYSSSLPSITVHEAG